MNVINGDCLEVMKTLPDKSIDLFICDLPYGCLSRSSIGALAEKKGFFSGNSVGCAWDIKLDLNAFWTQVKRLCKDDHTPVLMFCNTKFGNDLINSNPDWFRYDLVWNKMRGVSFLSANKMPMRSHELVYVFSKKGATYCRKDIEGDNTGKRCALSVIEMVGKLGKGNHPTAKPVELYKWLIERYSKKDDCVLDPTFGSGNSGRASAELERKYIGIEKDEKFFEKFKSTLDTNVSNPVAAQDKEVPRCV
jgi:site-specific DNA-methyltransferase (adenine-specific)